MTHQKQHILGWSMWLVFALAAAAFLTTGIHPLRQDEEKKSEVHGAAALAQGVLAGRDTLTHDYPAAWWGWSQVRESHNLPLWNPSWFCGEAFIASQTFMPFYPPNWLGAVLPFPLAFNIQYPLHLLLAAAVLAWAARRRGLGWVAAGLAGLSWGFGSHLATLAGPGHIQKLQTLAWLPLVTLGAWRIGRGDARAGLLPLGLGLALQITAGHMQIVYLTLAVALLEALAGFFGTATVAERGRPGYVPVDFRLALGGLALLFALGLSAVFWIPSAEFASLSNREGALPYEDATRGSLPPEEAFEFALPRLLGDSMPYGRGAQLLGNPFSNFYVGRYGESTTSSPERVVSDYAGAGALFFALFALLARRRGRRAAWGYALLAAGALVLSMGKYLDLAILVPNIGGEPRLPRFFYTSIYYYALKIIPGLAHFRSPSTMMAVLAYAVAMAAGLGVEGFLNPPEPDPAKRARARRLTGALLLLLAAAAAGLSIWTGGLARHTAALASQTPAQYRSLLAAAAWSTTARGLALVLALAGAWALLQPLRGRGFNKTALSSALLAGLALAWGWDLLDNVRPFWNAADVRPYAQFLTSHWAIPFWTRDDEPVRFLEPGNELSNRALTLSDFSHYLSIGSASGYHPVTYGKYEQIQQRLGFLNPNFLRLFNVKYLLWPAGADRNWPAGYHLAPGGAIAGKLLLYNPDIHYIRPVKEIVPVPDFSVLLGRLARADRNVYDSDTMLQSQVPKKDQERKLSFKPVEMQTRVLPLGPGETHITVAARQDCRLAISEPAAPGWRLRVAGGPAEDNLETLDGFCLVVGVLAGRHDLLLFYDPVSQRLGLFVTLWTLALAAYWAGRRAGRKLFPAASPGPGAERRAD